MLRKGNVSTEHTVWCARALNVGTPDELPFTTGSTVGHPYGCESHHQVAADARATRREARASGWVLTSRFGWLCPPCAVAYRDWLRRQRV